MEGRVIDIVAEQLGKEAAKVKMESELVELGMDSLDHVELVMMVEEEYQVEIPDEDGEKWKTVGDIVEYLKSKGVE
jgi:acyl carrier protein